MTIKTHIVGADNDTSVQVTQNRELVVNVSHDPVMQPSRRKPFRQYFTDTGLSTGSNDMGVDGSVTNVDFWIPADHDNDRYISHISIIVGYATTGQPNEWADGAALTNGIQLFFDQQIGAIDLHEGIKNNQDLFRLDNNTISATWEVRHVNATNDYGYFINFDLTRFAHPFGIKLDRGTTQRLAFCVKDNASAAVSFNAIASGFDRFDT